MLGRILQQEMGAPPIPEKRKYSIQSGMKVYFPQVRVMKENVNGEPVTRYLQDITVYLTYIIVCHIMECFNSSMYSITCHCIALDPVTALLFIVLKLTQSTLETNV